MRLQEDISFQSSDHEYSARWLISRPTSTGFGGSSSYVFLSKNRESVIKYYPRTQSDDIASARSQSFYEYWMTRYLLDKGLNYVLPISEYFSLPTGYVVVRPYIKGYQAPSVRRALGLERKIEQVANIYRPDELIQYIKDNSNIVNPERVLNGFSYTDRFGQKRYIWREGDFKKTNNWLRTSKGYILIDP